MLGCITSIEFYIVRQNTRSFAVSNNPQCTLLKRDCVDLQMASAPSTPMPIEERYRRKQQRSEHSRKANVGRSEEKFV